MTNLKSIISSFKTKDSLDTKIWNKTNVGYKLKPKVREQLLKISNEFFDSLKVDVIISDITMTGSLANFNWSNYSDIDLHLMADFKQFDEQDLPIYEELFLLKKTVFNEKHDIKILGYEVEVYVQDENEEHTSTGVYSIMNDEWIVEPKKEKVDIDYDYIKRKSEKWMKTIDSVLEGIEDEPYESGKKILKQIKEKIKKYRQCGLEKDGEYSVENLVFKTLRRNGYIEKVFDTQRKLTDDKLSIKEQKIEDPKLSKSEKSEKVSPNVENFYETLSKIDKNIYQQKVGNYEFQKDVETVQIALDILGYPLPRFGVDGKFGPETAKAVNNFKKDNNIKDKLINENFIISEGQLKSPLNSFQISNPFGEWRPRRNRYHKGVDLVADVGTPIYAPADGKVIAVKRNNGDCGHTISIQHDNNVSTLYCHCSKMNVTQGQNVSAGDLIGLTGGAKGADGAGNSSGPHLHFTVKVNNEAKDPRDYVDTVITYTKGGKATQEKIDKGKGRDSGEYEIGGKPPESKPPGDNKEDETILNKLKKILNIGDSEASNIIASGLSFISPEMCKKLTEKLKEKGITSEDISKYTKEEISYDDVIVSKDEDFYNAILDGIGAPKSSSNMRFLLAWRQAEGGKAKNNPFNTTQRMKKDPNISNYNYVGVKNYSTPQIGIEATVKTLLNGRYGCIVDGLKQEKDPKEIAQCDSLSTWGTRDLVYKVLVGNYGKINPKPIA